MTVVDSSRNLLADAAFSVLPEYFPYMWPHAMWWAYLSLCGIFATGPEQTTIQI
jgi:hypothetical protein